MNIIALTTCHNRRKKTLSVLKSLYAQILPGNCVIDICLVDDGSSDGTTEAVKANYTDVNVLVGTGDLYWAGGMRFGWENYVRLKEFDYLLVFNDDIYLYPDAVNRLIATALNLQNRGIEKFAVAGAFKSPDNIYVTYGGVVRNCRWYPLSFKKIRPTGRLQLCDTLNMNLALISSRALNTIGFLSSEFLHKGADYDFGLRLKEVGGEVVLAPGFIGECHRNSMYGRSEEPGISFIERWNRLTGIKEHPMRERAIYCRRHAGYFWPIYWFVPYAKGIFDAIINFCKKLRSLKS